MVKKISQHTRFQPLSLAWISFSCTPVREFRCFYTCEIILSQIPIPAQGKDKKGQPHAGRTLSHDVIVMLK